jgi:hypothetical protein
MNRDLGINLQCFRDLYQSKQSRRDSEAEPPISDVEFRVHVFQEDVAENPEAYLRSDGEGQLSRALTQCVVRYKSAHAGIWV